MDRITLKTDDISPLTLPLFALVVLEFISTVMGLMVHSDVSQMFLYTAITAAFAMLGLLRGSLPDTLRDTITRWGVLALVGLLAVVVLASHFPLPLIYDLPMVMLLIMLLTALVGRTA